MSPTLPDVISFIRKHGGLCKQPGVKRTRGKVVRSAMSEKHPEAQHTPG